MKKGKILSALLACSMSVVAASACAFTVGCKDKGGNEGGDNTGHQHTWATTWSHDDTNHWHACTADGHTGAHKDVAEHDYDNAQDTTCNTCDYVRTISGGGNEEENPNPPSTVKETVVWSVDDLAAGTLSEKTELKTGMGVYAMSKIVVESSSGKSYTYAGETKATKGRAKFNGSTDTLTKAPTEKALHVNVTENATVLVYAWSGSGGKTAYLSMRTADGKVVDGSLQQVSDGKNEVAYLAAFPVEKATDYYIVSDSTGETNAIFNYVAVVYGTFNETYTDVGAKDPDCATTGNIAHKASNYGRYLSADGQTKIYSVKLSVLGHQYTSPVTLTENLPTANSTATYTAHCIRQGCVSDAVDSDKTIIVPELSDRNYTQTEKDNETNPTKCKYTITVDGIEFSFVTDYVEPAAVKASYTVKFDGSITTADGYNLTGWAVSSSGYKATAGTVGSVSYAKGAKLNASGYIDIVITEDATVTFYSSANQTLKYATLNNGTAGTATTSSAATADGSVYKVTITLTAGSYRISRGASTEMALYCVVIAPQQS